VTNKVYLDNKVKAQQQQNKIKHKKPEQGIEPGTSRTQSRCITSAPPRVTIIVMLLNYFDKNNFDLNDKSKASLKELENTVQTKNMHFFFNFRKFFSKFLHIYCFDIVSLFAHLCCNVKLYNKTSSENL